MINNNNKFVQNIYLYKVGPANKLVPVSTAAPHFPVYSINSSHA